MRQAGGDPGIAAGHPPVNGLMIAFAFTLPYHVMRTAAAAGLRVHVLGAGASRGLRWSRCCRSYHETRCTGDPEALLAEIRDLARRYAIDVVFPADDVATRLLAALRDRLPVRAPPLPEPAAFDLLNDKWRFTRFCLANGVRAPPCRLFDSATGLRAAIAGGELALPLTAKPINRSGGVGVFHILGPGDIALIDAIDYRPVLVQRHIRGEALSITLLCDRGRVAAHVAQMRDAVRFRVVTDADLLAGAARLAALTRFHGTMNLDAVRSDADGLCYLVECNPRFWYSIYLAMLAGLNFVALALALPAASADALTLDAGEIRLSLRAILARPRRASRLDRRYLRYSLGDPLALAAQRAKLYDDRGVAVAVAPMPADSAGNPPDMPAGKPPRDAVRPSFTAAPHSAAAMRIS